MRITSAEIRPHLLPITLAQMVGLVCGVVGVRIGSHLVSPADYGRYGVFISLAPMGMSVVFAGLIKFAVRNWSGSGQRSQLLHEVAQAAIRKLPWLAAAATVATMVTTPSHAGLFGIALFFTSIGLAINQLAQVTLQADRRHWLDCGLTTAGSIARTFFPLLLYATIRATDSIMIQGFLAYSTLAALLGFIWLSRHWNPRTQVSTRTLPPAFDGPLFTVLALVGWGLSGLIRWVAAGFFGAETAGFFTLASNIGLIAPSMLAAVMLQLLQPRWFTPNDGTLFANRNLGREADYAAALYVALALSFTILLHYCMPLLVGSLVSERYSSAIGLVLPVGFFATAVLTPAFFHAFMLATHQESRCGPPELGGAAILAIGALTGAAMGQEWFIRWLLISPLVPWLINRPLAHHAVFNTTGDRGSAAGR